MSTATAASPAQPEPEPEPELQHSNLPIHKRYWNMNLPSSDWTELCPPFLLNISQKNITILSSPESEYHITTWPECKSLVRDNKIDHFQRPPIELRRYIHYITTLNYQHGSVLSFVQHHRLHWDTVSPSPSPPFTNPTDYKILYNDWPYGIDPAITHLVVWTKFLLEDEPETGFLTTEYYDLIESFVQRTFCNVDDGIDRADLVWFRNWKSLKSVHALEHFHVMLYQASEGFLRRITGGDKSMSETMA